MSEQIVTIFRNRLRPENRDAYSVTSARMTELAEAERARRQPEGGGQNRPGELDREVRELREELRQIRKLLEQMLERMDRR